jgi:hypothetical protein
MLNPRQTHAILRAALSVPLLASLCAAFVRADEPLGEYHAKAALVFNFARYTYWPPSSGTEPAAVLHICVDGDDDLARAFDPIVGRQVREREVRVRRVRQVEEALGCDVVFIGGHDRKRIAKLFTVLKDRSILSVGEIPDFADFGGIIHLYRSDGRIRFGVSLKAAARANLTLSASMLRLAKIVD